jgi:hypothetical protein
MAEGKALSTNTLPELKEELRIPLYFTKNSAATFYIEAEGINNFEPQEDVYLTDLKTNYTQNLSNNPIYYFISEEGDVAERFVIHFSPLGIDEPTTPQELIHIWSSNKTINILNTNNYVGDIKVLNMLGQNVLSTKLTGDKNQILMINAPSGYYIINTVTQKGVINKKLYLK